MEKITQLDMLVHPFFNYVPAEFLSYVSEEENRRRYLLECFSYGREESEIMRRVWERSVDEVREDVSRVMVFLGNTIRHNFFEDMKRGRMNKAQKYIYEDLDTTGDQQKEKFRKESELLGYAHQKLGDRLLFLQKTLVGEGADKLKGFLSSAAIDEKKFRANIYGEVTTSCIMREAENLGKSLPIRLRKTHIRLQPKKSVDWVDLVTLGIDGYPRIWDLEKIENIRKEGKIQKKERDTLVRFGVAGYREKRKKLFKSLFGDV